MGAQFARDLAEATKGDAPDALRLEQAVAYHLRGPYYPPLPYSLVQVAIEVIMLANEGNFDEEVYLPDGVTYRGGNLVPARVAVEAWHLNAFIDYEDE